MACKTQLDAMATGTPLIDAVRGNPRIRRRVELGPGRRRGAGKRLAWQALIRRLDREDPSYRD